MDTKTQIEEYRAKIQELLQEQEEQNVSTLILFLEEKGFRVDAEKSEAEKEDSEYLYSVDWHTYSDGFGLCFEYRSDYGSGCEDFDSMDEFIGFFKEFSLPKINNFTVTLKMKTTDDELTVKEYFAFDTDYPADDVEVK